MSYCGWTKSMSPHLRNPGMIRFPCGMAHNGLPWFRSGASSEFAFPSTGVHFGVAPVKWSKPRKGFENRESDPRRSRRASRPSQSQATSGAEWHSPNKSRWPAAPCALSRKAKTPGWPSCCFFQSLLLVFGVKWMDKKQQLAIQAHFVLLRFS